MGVLYKLFEKGCNKLLYEATKEGMRKNVEEYKKGNIDYKEYARKNCNSRAKIDKFFRE